MRKNESGAIGIGTFLVIVVLLFWKFLGIAQRTIDTRKGPPLNSEDALWALENPASAIKRDVCRVQGGSFDKETDFCTLKSGRIQ